MHRKRHANGEWQYATVTVRGTKRDANNELIRRLETVRTGLHIDPNRLTVGQWLQQWLDTVRQEVSPKTHERYTELVRNFLSAALGNILLAKLSPTQIQAAYNAWAVGGRRDGKAGGLAPRTRHHLHRVLKSALSRAVDDQLLVRNPLMVGRKRLPKVERPPMTILSPEQATGLLNGIRHTRVYWPVLMALATGMRRGEILALRWNAVDLGRGIVRVTESLEETRPGDGKACLRFKPTKSNNGRRVITLPGFALDELQRLKQEQAEELLKLGVRQSGETLVCGRGDGEPMVPKSLTHEFTRLMSRIGLPSVTFHSLRHTDASHLLKAGAHPKVVQERLGHSTIAITMDLYSHLMDGMEATAAKQIDALFRNSVAFQ